MSRALQSIITTGRRGQRGYLMLSLSLALIISAILAAQTWREDRRRDDHKMAEAQAQVLKNLRNIYEELLFEVYTDLQSGSPITRNGLTIPFGFDEGEAMAPTFAQLQAMGFGVAGIAETGSYKSLDGAGFVVRQERIPAGCETATPSGSGCQITGLICFDTPLRDPRTPVGSIDGEAIGRMMLALGADGGASLAGVAGGDIIGSQGDWDTENPVPDSPEGIVCTRYGFGASQFTNFLRVRDSRDPEFQNNVTIAGGLHVEESATVNASCSGRAEGIAVWGESNGAPIWLRCQGGIWVPGNGITYATAGDVCNAENTFGMEHTGVELTCRNNVWVIANNVGLYDANYFLNGAIVPRPDCGPGMSPSLGMAVVAASNIIGINNTGNNTGSFQVWLDMATWQIFITGADGTSAGNNAQALVHTYCS
jgi:hypothetical protein